MRKPSKVRARLVLVSILEPAETPSFSSTPQILISFFSPKTKNL
jgi:hypothetical protein